MEGSGRIVLQAVLPLLLLLGACTDPVLNVDEPAEVDSCDLLIAVGIELVNDYVYTMQDTDLGATEGDPALLPESLIALNARGEELDKRVADLGCDAVAINAAVAEATAGIETDDPLVQVFLDSVRGGIVAPLLPTDGDWVLESAAIGGGTLTLLEGEQITLRIEHDSVSGFSGCNGYYYPVTLADGIWAWGEGAATTTELLCVDEAGEERSDVAATEAGYIRAFELVAAYRLDGEDLVLSGDGVELRYGRSVGD